MSGIEMLEEIKKNNLKFDKNSSIFISGYLNDSTYFKKNNLKFIPKPFLLDVIMDEVSKSSINEINRQMY